MAETSGFFQAMLDETTGKYDRVYLAREFANYFALFVKNGVFGSPTNQLRVSPGSGLSISVAPGNAFIKGMWYNNSSVKNIVIVPNYTSSNRIDTVRIRMSDLTRSITAEVFTGDADLVRGEDVFDLQIATVTVKPGASSITAAEITDTRPNENVCGFVTQLLNVQTTADLFAQYNAQFNQWFASIQASLDENTAGNLQNQIDALNTAVTALRTSVNNVYDMAYKATEVWLSTKHFERIPPASATNQYLRYNFAEINNSNKTPYGYEVFYFGKADSSFGDNMFSVKNFDGTGCESQFSTILTYSTYDSTAHKIKTYTREFRCRGQYAFKMTVGPCYDEEGTLCPNFCVPFKVATYKKDVNSSYFTMIDLEQSTV